MQWRFALGKRTTSGVSYTVQFGDGITDDGVKAASPAVLNPIQCPSGHKRTSADVMEARVRGQSIKCAANGDLLRYDRRVVQAHRILGMSHGIRLTLQDQSAAPATRAFQSSYKRAL